MFKPLMLLLIFLTTSFCTNNVVNSKTKLPNEQVVNTPIKVEKSKSSENDSYNEMLRLVNQLRKKGCKCVRKRMRSVSSVRLNNLLGKSALVHAKDMAKNNFFEHEGSNGSSISDRISKTGYDWQAVGENIFWGDSTVKEVFQGWKDSPSHCKNMMNGDYKEMGVAQVGKYWVQDFGKTF